MTWKPYVQLTERVLSLLFFAVVMGGIVYLTFTDQFPKLRMDWDGDHNNTRVAGFIAKPVWLDASPPAHPSEWVAGAIAERNRILDVVDTIEIPGAEPNSEFARGYEAAVQSITAEIERINP